MPETLTVKLDKPIASVRGLNDSNGADQSNPMQKATFSQVCRALKSLVDKLNKFYDEVFAGHKEEIAKLSVEIARKILLQQVQEGNYEIESIVKEAIKNSPTHQDIVANLNPEDLAQLQALQKEDATGDFAGVKFVSDPNIGKAECRLETPKGVIESLIDEQLERIGNALKKTE